MWLAVFNVGYSIPRPTRKKAHVIYLVVCIINIVFNFTISGGMNKIKILR